MIHFFIMQPLIDLGLMDRKPPPTLQRIQCIRLLSHCIYLKSLTIIIAYTYKQTYIIVLAHFLLIASRIDLTSQ
ncbi:hypothetical protein B2K_18715 [Paenibacillus mucilaginosus K02]|uniref:Uncharacterized protein n=1 Tax=Paenibacillus mucilaginosus K02 TaxID=997761 RepID=I0BK28_9BACL|nr:hypothetical protein B2K_18715 [Paenibacillus mucilaginosus K02]